MDIINNNLKGKVSLGVFFLVIIIYGFYLYSNNKEQKLKKCFKVTTALIVNVKDGYKNNLALTYKYLVNGKIHCSDCVRSIKNTKLKNSLLNKNLVLIYSCTDSNDHLLLLSEYQFDEFNIPYPDSLLWIKQELDKGW